MEKLTIKNVALNFGGFYDSVHSTLIDTEIENILETENLEYDQICDYIDFKAIHLEYAKRLVLDFNNNFDLNLKFEQLIQPKEYNFTTDIIIVEMSMQDYNYLFLDTNQDKLNHKITKATTSRDGYSAFYNYSEMLNEPQFIAEFLLDIIMEGADYDLADWFYEDNQWFWEIIESAITNFREKEIKMKKLTKPETAKVIKVLAKALNYPNLKDQHRYVASSKFGELLLSFDLNCEVPTIYSRLRDFSKVINKEECVNRDFSQYSGKRNIFVFPKDIVLLVDEMKFNILMDKIEIIEDMGER